MRPPEKKRNTEPNTAEFKAYHNHRKIAPRKVRLVMARIRNLPGSEALDQLKHMRQRGAYLVDKVLKSAIANADHAIEAENGRNEQGVVMDPQPSVDVDDLYIHDAYADE